MWIVDLDRKDPHCFRDLQGGMYLSATVLHAAEVGPLSVLGMSLDLSGLF